MLLNNQLGVQNSQLLQCYAMIDDRVAYLVGSAEDHVVAKVLAGRRCRIRGFNMKMS